MAKLKENKNKLMERCDILEKLVIQISDLYNSDETSVDQKKLIETIIGAAIWYLPHGKKYWTNKISKEAFNGLNKNRNAKMTKEHQFPRKLSAKELLNNRVKFEKNETSILKLYEEKYAKFNYVTPQENKKISKYQREDVFVDIETAYANAEIELIEISDEEFKKLKKRN